MNWEAIGAVGEVLGAIGVIVTLAYLAVQIRQNTRAMEATALVSVHDIHALTYENDRYIGWLGKAARGEPVTMEERAQMVERLLLIMREFERIWYQQQMGLLSAGHFEKQIDLLRWALTMPAARAMWEHLSETFDPEFRAIVDQEVLAEDAPLGAMNRAWMALAPEAGGRE